MPLSELNLRHLQPFPFCSFHLQKRESHQYRGTNNDGIVQVPITGLGISSFSVLRYDRATVLDTWKSLSDLISRYSCLD